MLRRQRSDLEDRELEVMEAREIARRARSHALEARHGAARGGRSSRLAGVIAAAEAEIDAELGAEDGRARGGRERHRTESLLRRLRDAGRAQNQGAGAARLVGTTCQRVPPVDPVDRGRAHPAGRGRRSSRTATTAAPSSCRDPAGACRSSRRIADRLDEILLYCDGGSRGNPGPSAIGAVVFDAGDLDPPTVLATVSETHRRDDEQRRRIPGAASRASRPRPRTHARCIRVRADSLLMIKPAARRVAA